jgi:hypothetical protein
VSAAEELEAILTLVQKTNDRATAWIWIEDNRDLLINALKAYDIIRAIKNDVGDVGTYKERERNAATQEIATLEQSLWVALFRSYNEGWKALQRYIISNTP